MPVAYVVKADSDTTYLVLEQSGVASLRAPADPDDPQVPDSGGNSRDTGQAPTAGLTNALARLQGQPKPAPYRFEGTVAKTMYLDLDEQVTGTVYLSNSLSAVRVLESGIVRVALRVNGVLAGGMDFPLAPAAAATATAWVPIHYSFAPEVAVLHAGDKVALEITQLSGLADLRIGVGGNHQSHARLQSYAFDPLAGATYLEKHKLVIQSPDGNVSDTEFLALAEAAGRAGAYDGLEPGVYYLDAPEVPQMQASGLALGALAFAPLAWSAARNVATGRGRALVAACVIVLVALAGCSGKGTAGKDDANSDLPVDARPSVDTTVDDKTSEATEVGAGELAGAVRDWRNLTIESAYVAILGTSHFMETDVSGRFSFGNMTAGKYVLRVDATDMRSIEEKVEVFADKRTVVTIKMAPLDPNAPDRFAHIHDEWRGGSPLTIIDTTFTPDTSKAYFVSQPSGGAPVCVPWDSTGIDGRLADDLCMWPIPIELDAKVPPGAGAIQVTLDWTGDATEMGLRAYQPVTRKEVNATFLARGPGETTTVVFFPHEADPGHQGFTNWVFGVYIPESDPTTFGQQPVIDVGDVTVTALAHRTVIPFEPGHPDLWAGADEIKLVQGATTTFGTVTETLPHSGTFFVPGKGSFVPGDAARIEGKFTISRGTAGEPALLQTLGLSYKPANIPTSRFAEGLKPIELQGAFPEYTFSFPIVASDADQPYQTFSNFLFYPTSDADYAYRQVITFTLEATVHKA